MTRPALAAGLLAANLVLLSLFDHVQPHFTALIGVAMMACCSYLVGVAVRGSSLGWLWLLVPVMLLWNPVAPVAMGSADYLALCGLAITGLVAAAFLMKFSPRAYTPRRSATNPPS